MGTILGMSASEVWVGRLGVQCWKAQPSASTPGRQWVQLGCLVIVVKATLLLKMADKAFVRSLMEWG